MARFFAFAVASLIALPRNVSARANGIEDSATNNPSPGVGCIKQAQFHGTDSLRAPPPQPSPASGRGSKKALSIK
jgi:hypothetical protein